MENEIVVKSPLTPVSGDTTDKLDVSGSDNPKKNKRKLDDVSTKEGMEKVIQKELAKIKEDTDLEGNDETDEDDEIEVSNDPTVPEIPKLTKEDLSIDLSMDNLLESNGQLDEDFKVKTQQLFETAVLTEVNRNLEMVRDVLNEEYASQAAEMREYFTETIDVYMDRVVEDFVGNNAETITSEIREHKLSEFFNGVVALAEEAGIDVDTDGEATIEAVEKENKELKAALSKEVSKTIKNKSETDSIKAETIKEKVSEGLTIPQQDKLYEMADHVVFIDSLDYEIKLQDLRESFVDNYDEENTNFLNEEINLYEENYTTSDEKSNKNMTDIDYLAESVTALVASQNKYK